MSAPLGRIGRYCARLAAHTSLARVLLARAPSRKARLWLSRHTARCEDRIRAGAGDHLRRHGPVGPWRAVAGRLPRENIVKPGGPGWAPRSEFVVEQGEDRQVVQPVVFHSRAAERPFAAEACLLGDPYRGHVVRVRRQPGPLDAAFGKRPPGDRAERLRSVSLAAFVAADAVAELRRADLPVRVEQADRPDNLAGRAVQHHQVDARSLPLRPMLAGREPPCHLTRVRRCTGRQRLATPVAAEEFAHEPGITGTVFAQIQPGGADDGRRETFHVRPPYRPRRPGRGRGPWAAAHRRAVVADLSLPGRVAPR